VAAPQLVELAFDVAHRLRMRSCAMDWLVGPSGYQVTEVSYTFPSPGIDKCPGYWDSQLCWHDRKMWPEEAQAEDFIARLEARDRG
jgi:hypothetical protein